MFQGNFTVFQLTSELFCFWQFVSKRLQGALRILRLSGKHGWFKSVSRWSEETSRAFQVRLKGVLRGCQGSFKDVSWKFQGCFKSFSKMVQGSFKKMFTVFLKTVTRCMFLIAVKEGFFWYKSKVGFSKKNILVLKSGLDQFKGFLCMCTLYYRQCVMSLTMLEVEVLIKWC